MLPATAAPALLTERALRQQRLAMDIRWINGSAIGHGCRSDFQHPPGWV